MYKIAVLGDKESVLGFMSVGFEVFIAKLKEDAEKSLQNLIKNNYTIIYITENFYIQLQETIDRYKDNPFPAIISIPGKSGTTGSGLAAVKRAVERAIGADITLND